MHIRRYMQRSRPTPMSKLHRSIFQCSNAIKTIYTSRCDGSGAALRLYSGNSHNAALSRRLSRPQTKVKILLFKNPAEAPFTGGVETTGGSPCPVPTPRVASAVEQAFRSHVPTDGSNLRLQSVGTASRMLAYG